MSSAKWPKVKLNPGVDVLEGATKVWPFTDRDSMADWAATWGPKLVNEVRLLLSRIAELDEQLTAAISERDEYRSFSQHSKSDKEAMGIIHRAAELLRGDINVHAENEAMRGVVNAAVRYWRSYFNPELDKCLRPWASDGHEDHVCVVSLRGAMHIAIGDYVTALDEAQASRKQTVMTDKQERS